MDLKLPTMNGYEATKVIKQINPKIRIIAQTAYAMFGDREKALSVGCDDYITKPLDLKKLEELIKIYF
jgi:CheY-like chemotaxis protein